MSVGDKYLVAQGDWPVDTAEARAVLLRQVAMGLDGKDLVFFEAALDRYVTALLFGISKAILDVPHTPTALTGPYWYGQGWEEAAKHIGDIAFTTDPD